MIFFFFFQAEDGIRDGTVTGVQTCALPISREAVARTTWSAAGARSCGAGGGRGPPTRSAPRTSGRVVLYGTSPRDHRLAHVVAGSRPPSARQPSYTSNRSGSSRYR